MDYTLLRQVNDSTNSLREVRASAETQHFLGPAARHTSVEGCSLQILGRWRGMRRSPYVFHNEETGGRFKDVKLVQVTK